MEQQINRDYHHISHSSTQTKIDESNFQANIFKKNNKQTNTTTKIIIMWCNFKKQKQ